VQDNGDQSRPAACSVFASPRRGGACRFLRRPAKIASTMAAAGSLFGQVLMATKISTTNTLDLTQFLRTKGLNRSAGDRKGAFRRLSCDHMFTWSAEGRIRAHGQRSDAVLLRRRYIPDFHCESFEYCVEATPTISDASAENTEPKDWGVFLGRAARSRV
jgi:hypothetical protein